MALSLWTGIPMTALARFSAAAQGKQNVEQHTILPDTNSPGVSVTQLFQFQSYFDDTLLEKALLIQSSNEPIVGSTMTEVKIGGYALALHPSSQTPVAVLPLVGGSGAAPSPIILRPGQVYRPHGRPGMGSGNFSTFKMGLPFGWLGGGMATVYVLPSSDAKVDWVGEAPEIIYHRQRMQIVAPAALPANARFNWPLRFPWTQALRGATAISQAGKPIVGIARPTRVLMSLRLASLGAAATMRIIYQGTNDMDLTSAGAVIATPARFTEYVWGQYAANGGAGNLSLNYPVVEMNGEIVRLAADDGGVQLVDMSASALTNAFCDVVRYGIL